VNSPNPKKQSSVTPNISEVEARVLPNSLAIERKKVPNV
jgi:hypothetical protein